MFHSRAACTRELDDADLAVREICSALSLSALPGSKVGLIICEQEFVENGIMQAVAKSLPFDTIGCTTTFSGIGARADAQQLNVMVFASDDTEMAAGLSVPFSTEPDTFIRRLHSDLRPRVSSDPALAVMFAPMLLDTCLTDDQLASLIHEEMGKTPVFGTLSCSYASGEYTDSGILYNGDFYNDRAAMLLLAGPLRPRFALAAIPEDRILRQKAIITKAEGTLLMEINGRPVSEYLDSLGLLLDGKFVGIHAYPLIMDKGGGEQPCMRTVYGLTPEGYLQCGREMVTGAGLSIGVQDMAAIKSTTKQVTGRLRQEMPAHAALIFSCHSRSLSLGLEEKLESDLIDNALSGEVPYLFAYSGGEICPFVVQDGRFDNSFHSDTLIACIF